MQHLRHAISLENPWHQTWVQVLLDLQSPDVGVRQNVSFWDPSWGVPREIEELGIPWSSRMGERRTEHPGGGPCCCPTESHLLQSLLARGTGELQQVPALFPQHCHPLPAYLPVVGSRAACPQHPPPHTLPAKRACQLRKPGELYDRQQPQTYKVRVIMGQRKDSKSK